METLKRLRIRAVLGVLAWVSYSAAGMAANPAAVSNVHDGGSTAKARPAEAPTSLHWIKPIERSEKSCLGKDSGKEFCSESHSFTWHIQSPENKDDPCSAVNEEDVVSLLSAKGATIRVISMDHYLCMNDYQACVPAMSPVMGTRRYPTSLSHDACLVTFGFARGEIEGISNAEVSMTSNTEGELRSIEEIKP